MTWVLGNTVSSTESSVRKKKSRIISESHKGTNRVKAAQQGGDGRGEGVDESESTYWGSKHTGANMAPVVHLT